jgi:hypothetical protein
MVEHLLSKCEDLSPIQSTTKKKKSKEVIAPAIYILKS